jgi:PIN domain nuclease of toxin-antitoxin system
MILLDTHVWLWWLLEEGDLDESERSILDEQALNGEIVISAATIWEAELMQKKGFIHLAPDFETWIGRATDEKICKVLPIDEKVILAQKRLPKNFPDDPADRIIVATALLNEIPLATKNETLQNLGF